MSLIIRIIHPHFTKFGIIQSQEQPNLKPVKTFILDANANSKINIDF
jgi:hypothetical protein